MAKVKPGDPLEVPAKDWNALLDMLAKQQQQPGGAGVPSVDPLARNTGIVRVKNASGSDVGQFGVLGIDAPLFALDAGDDRQKAAALQTFRSQVLLKGVTPNVVDHWGKFVVLLDPLKDGAIGRAWIAGVCPAKINVLSEAHAYVNVGGSRDTLASTNSGSLILWREDGTGVKWGVVSLGPSPLPPGTGRHLGLFLIDDLVPGTPGWDEVRFRE